MGDRELRREGRAALAGDEEAMARHLAGLLRAGQLDPARLAVAVAAGDPAAARVAPGPGLPPLRTAARLGPLRWGAARARADLQTRVRALAAFGAAPCQQAALAAVTAQASSWSGLERWLRDLTRLCETEDAEAAGDLAAELCLDLALEQTAPIEALDAAIVAHLRAWGRGQVERPRWAGDPEVGREEGPIAKLALRLLEDALSRGCQGVGLEPLPGPEAGVGAGAAGGARVLFLRGEAAEERMLYPRAAHEPLVGRLLALAGLDPLPGAGPQETELPPARLARPPGRPPTPWSEVAPLTLRSLPGAAGTTCEVRWRAPAGSSG